MGAVINMEPNLYHGVIAHVPFVDVITTMLDETIPLTTGEYDEWGNPNNKDYYDYMKSYSPYDNVEEKNYPNLLKKDLLKFFDIFLNEIKMALKNNERVELRGWGVFYQKIQKSRNSRNPKTGERISVSEKKNINFKMSKDLFQVINEK